jgi:energy-coupling factor transport system permease protein
MADAHACRPWPGPRIAVLRAVATNTLDRAVDVAATLEVRGYGAARGARLERAPWSRHDLAFAAAASALVVLVIGAHVAGLAAFAAYPALHAPVGAAELLLAGALIAAALAPFLDRRGIEP